jgi:hypothetical protein
MFETTVLQLWLLLAVFNVVRGVLVAVYHITAREPERPMPPWPVAFSLLIVEYAVLWVFAYLLVELLA